MRFLEVVFALAIKEFEQRRSKLTCRKRREINSRRHIFIHESVRRCYAVFGFARNLDLIR